MEKKEFIRNGKEAAAFFGLTGKNKLSEELIVLKKVECDDAPNRLFIVWCYEVNESTYVGVTVEKSVINFNASQILNWLPYNGETIGQNQFLLFDLNAKPYIETLLMPDGNEAEQILRQKFPLVQGGIRLISSYQFGEGNRFKKLEYLWAMRIDLHYYEAISPFTGKLLHIRNYGDDLKEIFRPGDAIGEYYTLADVDGNLSLKRR